MSLPPRRDETILFVEAWVLGQGKQLIVVYNGSFDLVWFVFVLFCCLLYFFLVFVLFCVVSFSLVCFYLFCMFCFVLHGFSQFVVCLFGWFVGLLLVCCSLFVLFISLSGWFDAWLLGRLYVSLLVWLFGWLVALFVVYFLFCFCCFVCPVCSVVCFVLISFSLSLEASFLGCPRR